MSNDKPTWKEIKQAYLLTLIKHGDLSRGHLDSLIGEAQRMTSDRGVLQATTVEDMGRVVEAYEGDSWTSIMQMVVELKNHCKFCSFVAERECCGWQSGDYGECMTGKLISKLEGK